MFTALLINDLCADPLQGLILWAFYKYIIIKLSFMTALSILCIPCPVCYTADLQIIILSCQYIIIFYGIQAPSGFEACFLSSFIFLLSFPDHQKILFIGQHVLIFSIKNAVFMRLFGLLLIHFKTFFQYKYCIIKYVMIYLHHQTRERHKIEQVRERLKQSDPV